MVTRKKMSHFSVFADLAVQKGVYTIESNNERELNMTNEDGDYFILPSMLKSPKPNL